nr:metallophosphoesterase family protein [Leadbetterella sp.]
MALIGLISDTHSYLDPAVFEHFKYCDEIWHIGDIGERTVLDQLKDFKPLKAVFGNIDSQEL